MKQKLIFAAALLVLTFAASDATTARKGSIKIVYQADANGDFRVFLFGSDRALVCEEKAIQVASQGDAVNPVILSCKH
jgi:hypothetical protein